MANEKSNLWSDAELEACVDAYLYMAHRQVNGIPFIKAQLHRDLQTKVQRTVKSIEYRMQNLSSLMKELSLPIVKGYMPADNLGPSVKGKVLAMLEARGFYYPDDYAPTADDTALHQKAHKFAHISTDTPPPGIEHPQPVSGNKTSYARDPRVRAWILKIAEGICEGCGQLAPFKLANGDHFLEVHHVRHLAEHGSDTHTNAVALCPNCHRRCHLSEDREAFTQSLYQKIGRLKSETT